jgi:hypothetical protein
MKVLCLGNNSVDTDMQTSALADESSTPYYGLISDHTQTILEGFYQTSIFDLNQNQIIELLTKFDLLILLNQPIEQWSHPDAFYLTAKVIDVAETKIKVKRLMDYSNINFFESLVHNNKSFCIFPFIELLAQNGSTTVCCRSHTPITKLNKILNWADDPNYKIIRDKMIAGELVPEHCSTCYAYEKLGIASARQQETVEWANRLNLKSIEDILKIQSPVYYEVRPSNVCNLQCRTCGPENSSLIEKEYINIGWHDPAIKFDYAGFDFIKFDNLKKMYVAGGEPTATKEFYSFLDRCVEENNTDFELLINTNANKISNSFLSLCSNFSNLQFIISIDGFQEVNDYVRWPSAWGTVIENSKKLNKNHKISFNVVVSLYTISRLDQLLEFFDKEFSESIVHCTFAESDNNMLHPYNFPDWGYIRNKIKRIKNFNCYNNDRLLKSFIDGLLCNDIENNLDTLKNFFTFNDALDKLRNTKLVDYIPELDKFRHMVLE